MDSFGPLCQWGTLTDEQLRPDSSYSGLQLAGAQYYDSTTGKWVDRAPTPKNSYGPVHIGDAIIGTEGGIVNALWKSVAAPIVDQMLKAKGITQLNAKQQALLDRGLNPYKIDQNNPIQRAFAISGEGTGVAIGAMVSARSAAGGPRSYSIKPGSLGGTAAGKAFPKSVKARELRNNPWNCVYCRMPTKNPHVDHIIPRSRGGNAMPENAQIACPHCNTSKGARDFPVTPPAGYVGDWPPAWWRG